MEVGWKPQVDLAGVGQISSAANPENAAPTGRQYCGNARRRAVAAMESRSVCPRGAGADASCGIGYPVHSDAENGEE